jgi:hypothetical protein
MIKMEYNKSKQRLEEMKQELIDELENPDLTTAEIERLKMYIANYEYIIELTDMNHYARGPGI